MPRPNQETENVVEFVTLFLPIPCRVREAKYLILSMPERNLPVSNGLEEP